MKMRGILEMMAPIAAGPNASQKSSFKIFVLLPAYNEEKALRKLTPEIGQTLVSLKISYTICIVDDGSSDGTKTLVSSLSRELPIVYLPHSKNQGYGAALRTGFIWIAKNAAPNDIAISLDSDYTHLPLYMPEMINKLQSGYDIVTASYSMPGGRALGVPLKRRLTSFLANLLFNISFQVPGTHSLTNGFRAYRIKVLQDAYKKYGDNLIQESGFPGGMELFLKCCRLGVKTSEIPFVLQYQNRGSESKMNVIQTSWRYLQLVCRLKSHI